MTEALTGSSVSAAPKPKPKRDKEVEKMEPKTVIEQAQDHMDSCLKKAADARKHAISLGGTGYGGDLSTQLMNFQFQNGSCLQAPTRPDCEKGERGREVRETLPAYCRQDRLV